MLDYIGNIFSGIRFFDFIDIFIISVFVYLFIIWLERARVRFILIGMIIVCSIYVFAQVFHLYLTIIIFQAFFAVSVIVIIVIFQDDLRHLFERIGVMGVTRQGRNMSFEQSINVITGTVASLARKKIGALIVLQGKDPAERYLEAGVNTDSLVSQILLESIFDPHVPSHDGAVIIGHGRMLKLGCHLPLSSNMKEIGRLGTRHAAGLGLAEKTDALCIIVSEEKGEVSIAEECSLKHVKDISLLQGILEDFYRRKISVERNSILRGFFTSHILEKIIAIIVACILWVVIAHSNITVRRDFVMPVEYQNLDPNIIINEPKVKEVTVTLSGFEQKFKFFKQEGLKLSIDASVIQEGKNKIIVTKKLIKGLSGLSVVNIEPDEILVNAYETVMIVVPVEARTKGRSPPHVKVKNILIEPNKVQIKVPLTTMKEKLKIFTEPINLSLITGTTVLTPALVIPSEVRFFGNKQPEVKVTIDVENINNRNNNQDK